jgi:hypothetical protein
MPVVIQCPHCKVKMSVGEGRVGEEVKCPGCRQPFTAEAKEGSKTRSKPVKRKARKKASQNTLGVLLSVMIGGTFLLFLTLVWYTNRNKERPEVKPFTPEPGRPLVFDSKDSPRKPGDTSETGDGKSSPEGSASGAADRALADVYRLVEQFEKNEPANTAKALDTIPDSDRERATLMMKEAAGSAEKLTEYGPKLSKWGLTDWITVTSAKHARSDSDFRSAAGAFAAAGLTPAELLVVLGRWYLVPDTDRKTIATAAQEGWPPTRMPQEARDAVVMIGAGKWLQR